MPAAHKIARTAAEGGGFRWPAQQILDRCSQCARVALWYQSRRDPIGGNGSDTTSASGHERRGRSHHFHHGVRKSIDIPGIVVHGRGDRDIGRSEQGCHVVMRHNSEKLDCLAGTCRECPRPK